MNTVPLDIAQELCADILAENARKWYTLQALECWGCLLFSESALDRMCILSPRGCSLVNARFARRVQGGMIAPPHP